MAIVICVADGFGGNGDFIFALKMASELRKELREKGLYNEDILIVTEQSGKDKIEALGGDKEFNISVINHEEYKNKVASGELSIDYFLAGPVFNPFLNTPTGLKVPPNIPVMLIGEYSVHPSGYQGLESLRNLLSKTNPSVDVIQSGLHTNINFYGEATQSSNDNRIYNEQGIILTSELCNAATSKEKNDFSFREKYWNEVGNNFQNVICKGKNISEYHSTTELSFSYCHDDKNAEGSTLQFLNIYTNLNKVFEKYCSKLITSSVAKRSQD